MSRRADAPLLPHQLQRLSFLGLERVPDERADDVVELHAAGNRFRSLEWVGPFRQLRLLDVRHNLLHRVTGIGACASTLVELDLRDNKLADGMLLAGELLCLKALVMLDARHNPFSKGFYDASIAVSPPVPTTVSLRTTCPVAGEVPEGPPTHARLQWRGTLILELPRLAYLDGLEVDLLERRLGARACEDLNARTDFKNTPTTSLFAPQLPSMQPFAPDYRSTTSPVAPEYQPTPPYGASAYHLTTSQFAPECRNNNSLCEYSGVRMKSPPSLLSAGVCASSMWTETVYDESVLGGGALQRPADLPPVVTEGGLCVEAGTWSSITDSRLQVQEGTPASMTAGGLQTPYGALPSSSVRYLHTPAGTSSFMQEGVLPSPAGTSSGPCALESDFHPDASKVNSMPACSLQVPPATSCSSCSFAIPEGQLAHGAASILQSASLGDPPLHIHATPQMNIVGEGEIARRASILSGPCAQPADQGSPASGAAERRKDHLEREPLASTQASISDHKSLQGEGVCTLGSFQRADDGISQLEEVEQPGMLSPDQTKAILRRRFVDWQCALVNSHLQERCLVIAQVLWGNIAVRNAWSHWMAINSSSSRRLAHGNRACQQPNDEWDGEDWNSSCASLSPRTPCADNVQSEASSATRFGELEIGDTLLQKVTSCTSGRRIQAAGSLSEPGVDDEFEEWLGEEGDDRMQTPSRGLSLSQGQYQANCSAPSFPRDDDDLKADWEVGSLTDLGDDGGDKDQAASAAVGRSPLSIPSPRRGEMSPPQRDLWPHPSLVDPDFSGLESVDAHGLSTTPRVSTHLPSESQSVETAAHGPDSPSATQKAISSRTCGGGFHQVTSQDRAVSRVLAGAFSLEGSSANMEEGISTPERSTSNRVTPLAIFEVSDETPGSEGYVSRSGRGRITEAGLPETHLSPRRADIRRCSTGDSRLAVARHRANSLLSSLSSALPASSPLVQREWHGSSACSKDSQRGCVPSPPEASNPVMTSLDSEDTTHSMRGSRCSSKGSRVGVPDGDGLTGSRRDSLACQANVARSASESSGGGVHRAEGRAGVKRESPSCRSDPGIAGDVVRLDEGRAVAGHNVPASRATGVRRASEVSRACTSGDSPACQTTDARSASESSGGGVRRSESRARVGHHPTSCQGSGIRRASEGSRAGMSRSQGSEGSDRGSLTCQGVRSASECSEGCTRCGDGSAGSRYFSPGCQTKGSRRVSEDSRAGERIGEGSAGSGSDFQTYQTTGARRPTEDSRAGVRRVSGCAGAGRDSPLRQSIPTGALEDQEPPSCSSPPTVVAGYTRQCRLQQQSAVAPPSPSSRTVSAPSRERPPGTAGDGSFHEPRTSAGSNFAQDAAAPSYAAPTLSSHARLRPSGSSGSWADLRPGADHSSHTHQVGKGLEKADQAEMVQVLDPSEGGLCIDGQGAAENTESANTAAARGVGALVRALVARGVSQGVDLAELLVELVAGGQLEVHGESRTSRGEKSVVGAQARMEQKSSGCIPQEATRRTEQGCIARYPRGQASCNDDRSVDVRASGQRQEPSSAQRLGSVRGRHKGWRVEPTPRRLARPNANSSPPRSGVVLSGWRNGPQLHEKEPVLESIERGAISSLRRFASENKRGSANVDRRDNEDSPDEAEWGIDLEAAGGVDLKGHYQRFMPWYPPGRHPWRTRGAPLTWSRRPARAWHVPHNSSKDSEPQCRHEFGWPEVEVPCGRVRTPKDNGSFFGIAYEGLHGRSKEDMNHTVYAHDAQFRQTPSAFVPRVTLPLALGAMVMELNPSSETFHQLQQLLVSQPPCHEGHASQWRYDILRVLQCRHHLIGNAPTSKARDVSPFLAFVCGDLEALTRFIRHGLRLNCKTPWGRTNDGLLVSKELIPQPLWQEAARSDTCETGFVVGGVWRVVLAICWQDGSDSDSGCMIPSFVIDYSIEALGAQLHV